MLIAGVALAGAAGIGVRIPDLMHWNAERLLAFLGLTAAIFTAELFPLNIRVRTEILYLSLTDAVWMAGLLILLAPPAIAGHPGLAEPGVLTLAVGAGALVGQAIRRRAPVKIAFNVGQFLLAITLAEEVFRALHSPSSSHPAAWAAAILSMAVCFAANATLTALVIALVERKPLPRVLLPPLGANLLHWAGNMAMGVVGAVMWYRARFGLPLLVVPLVLSYFAYRAWLQGMRERDRMRNLYEAGRALFGPLDAKTDFRAFLGLVQQLLDANGAELVVVSDDGVTIHDGSGVESLVAGSDNGHGAGAPQAYVRVREGLSPQVAMVGEAGDVRAVLAVYRPEALMDSERALLEALASQVRVRLVNQRLFAETVEQRTQLADIIAHTSDGIFALSPDGRIVSWNPAMEHITGWSTRRAVGRFWEDVLGPRADRDGGLGDGTAADDVLLMREDGAQRWIRYTRTPVRDRAGHLTAEVVVARDVTADMEAELLKADFVATVSHELRSPLTPLKGFLSTLMSGTGEDSPEARAEFYRIMDKQVNRLERLITDLLEVSRIEAAQVPVDSTSVDLTALVAEHLDEVRRDQPHRSMQLRAPGHPVFVHADPFRVAQVVANLLSNALKYSLPETPVEVTVASAGEQAIVSVRDEGEGIPLSEQDRVFDRFHRVESGLTRRTGGTGLGLYIAKRLVEAMGGRLWVVSSPGSGSTFSFSLPAATASTQRDLSARASVG